MGGYTIGRYEYVGLSSPAFPPRRELGFSRVIHGPLLGVDMAFGWALKERVALALDTGLVVIPSLANGRLAHTSIDAALSFHLGPVVDFYPAHHNPTHFQAGLSFASAAFAYGTDSVGAADNIVTPNPVAGAMVQVGAAYDLTRAFTIGARGSFAFLWNEHATYAPANVWVDAAYVYF